MKVLGKRKAKTSLHRYSTKISRILTMEVLGKRKAKTSLHRHSTKRNRKTHNSSPASSFVDQVPNDILRSIFNRLTFMDFVRVKGVCSSWNSLGQEFVSRMPWLMLPSKEEIERGDGTDVDKNGYRGFLNLGESQVYSLKTMPREFRECCCIGSSNGWLIFLERKGVPLLFNPFKLVKKQFPSVNHLLGLPVMERNCSYNKYRACLLVLRKIYVTEQHGDYYVQKEIQTRGPDYVTKQHMRDYYVQKAILTGEPDCNNNNNKNYGLILLCKEGKKIAYIGSGDGSWTVLDACHPPYQDIICHGNILYALSEKNNIEAWDVVQGGCVSKIFALAPPFPDKSLAQRNTFGYLCTNRFYLVESCGDLLLAVRYIGEFVDSDGTLVSEPDSKVCPYRTCLFHVYKLKLNFNDIKWVEMESLGDRALFLGGNHSVSVSAPSLVNCEKNSIYFTDDYWERMDEDYLYGGHDMGIYNLRDESVKPIYKFSSDKIQPPPCWIIPKQAMQED